MIAILLELTWFALVCIQFPVIRGAARSLRHPTVLIKSQRPLLLAYTTNNIIISSAILLMHCHHQIKGWVG